MMPKICRVRRVVSTLQPFEVLDERTVPAISLFDPRVVDLGAMQPGVYVELATTQTGVRVLGNGLPTNSGSFIVDIPTNGLVSLSSLSVFGSDGWAVDMSPNGDMVTGYRQIDNRTTVVAGSISGAIDIGSINLLDLNTTFGRTISDNGVLIFQSGGAFNPSYVHSSATEIRSSLPGIYARGLQVSADGQTIVGDTRTAGPAFSFLPTIWKFDDVQPLIVPNLNTELKLGSALDVSPDGNIAVGFLEELGATTRSFYLWNTTTRQPVSIATTNLTRFHQYVEAEVTNNGFVVFSDAEDYFWHPNYNNGQARSLKSLFTEFGITTSAAAGDVDVVYANNYLYILDSGKLVRFTVGDDQSVTLNGTPGDDHFNINLSNYANLSQIIVNGFGGNDSVVIGGSTFLSKTIQLNLGDGNDSLQLFDSVQGPVTIKADLGIGDDTFYGNSVGPTVQMLVSGGLGRDFIATGAGGDQVDDVGDDGGYVITLGGNDLVNLQGSNFVVTTGDGADEILGSFSNSHVYSEAGNDQVVLAGDSNVIFGGVGDDEISVDGQHNSVSGQAGNDALHSLNGFNVLDGGIGSDVLRATNAVETLLIGGTDADTFIATDPISRSVLILDFVMSEDILTGF